jgi:hypothetical protein
MSAIHIARDHKPLGAFPEEEIREGILSGKYAATDLAWREGMSEWKPLGEMAPLWGMETPPPSLPEASLIPVEKAPGELPAEGGPAWEERERIGLFQGISQTVSAVLMRPAETFATMRHAGGLAQPLLYFVLLSSCTFAIAVLYEIAASQINPALLGTSLSGAAKGAYPVAAIGTILISPALYVVSAFLSSGVTHLSLMLLGGANRPFETTFRVICYAQASASVFNLLPLCGGLIALFWGAYVIIIGLREGQGISGGKATLALTLPGLACCLILLALGAAAGVGMSELYNHGGLTIPTLPSK